MKINSIEIQNFRAISSLTMNELGQVVVVAGPNGCGKSTIFDAIRLIKSAYGDYTGNELQQYHNEFQLKFDRDSPANLVPLFQDSSKEMRIEVVVELCDTERSWLLENATRLLELRIINELNPSHHPIDIGSPLSLAAQARLQAPKLRERIKTELIGFEEEIKKLQYVGELTVSPLGEPSLTPSLVLEQIFGLFDPKHLGIIDYHGPQRNYDREQLGGIDLRIESGDKRHSQNALYNYKSKYTNIKTELASEYIRELLAREVGKGNENATNLTQTLKELFLLFFEGKEFVGPEPTPELGLKFNVRLANGSVHDINELSSGEKELLFGYLRLRNSAPKNSIILIDEPELHLNPRLTNGLVDFYLRHLSIAQNNQLWLVTHSDSILRQAVSNPSVSVFHMQPSDLESTKDQLIPVLATQELERAIIDLVGDLAVYRPGEKLVLLEGHEDVEFDERMVRQLFPELVLKVNLLSSGNKRRVRNLYDLLDQVRESGAIPVKVYSITDRDFGDEAESGSTRAKTWDVFHIENYLLEPRFLIKVMSDLAVNPLPTEGEVVAMLKACASATKASLVRHELENFVYHELISKLSVKIDPNSASLSEEFSNAVVRSVSGISAAANTTLTAEMLREKEALLTRKYDADLETGNWQINFRGRDVLKQFVQFHLRRAIQYEGFRDLLIAAMRDAGYRPAGMQVILDEIVSDS